MCIAFTIIIIILHNNASEKCQQYMKLSAV